MKWLLPALLTSAVVFILLNYQSKTADNRNELRLAVKQVKKHIKHSTPVGCNTDTSQQTIFNECRYWMASRLLCANRPELDTQLIIAMNRSATPMPVISFAKAMDTFVIVRKTSITLYLLKARR